MGSDAELRAISIHSLRMEGDHTASWDGWTRCYFNPLPPYGGRLTVTNGASSGMTFQSTPSVWRETRPCLCCPVWNPHFNPLPPYGGRRAYSNDFCIAETYFNPLPPYGGRLYPTAFPEIAADISIHSLRMEGDHNVRIQQACLLHFNPLPPYGGRPFSVKL